MCKSGSTLKVPCETPFQPHFTPSAPRAAIPTPITPPIMLCLVYVGEFFAGKEGYTRGGDRKTDSCCENEVKGG